MLPQRGETYLITTDDWFFGPDGAQYKAVFGTVHGIYSDAETLGIKTNAKSTNWYLAIGNMCIAGCQIHYAVKTNTVNLAPYNREIEHGSALSIEKECGPRIYNADNKEV